MIEAGPSQDNLQKVNLLLEIDGFTIEGCQTGLSFSGENLVIRNSVFQSLSFLFIDCV